MFDKIKEVLGGKGGGDRGDLSLGGFEKYLEGVDYPIGIDDLMAAIKSNGAPARLQGVLQTVGVKGKHTFNSQEDVVNSMRGEIGSMT